MNKLRAALIVLAAVCLVLLPAATASDTPNPASVTVAGSLQSEAGCPGDWDPACAVTHLTYDANDDVWQGTFSLPAGAYEYKAALNDSWTENYGLNAQLGGSNIPLSLASDASVKFYYDHESHWITDNKSSVIAVARGELPVRARLLGRLGPGLSPFLARGHERRRDLHVRDDRASGGLVRDEGRDRRGLGGELRPGRRPGRIEHPVHGSARQCEGHLQLRRLDARADCHGGRPAGCTRRAFPLRPGPQGLPGDGAQHDVEGLVHGCGRRAQRRVLPDDRQHERRDVALRRHRRFDLHRCSGPRHHVHG